MDGWMDGWMDGGCTSVRCRYAQLYACMRVHACVQVSCIFAMYVCTQLCKKVVRVYKCRQVDTFARI